MRASMLVCPKCGPHVNSSVMENWVLHALKDQRDRWICRHCGSDGIVVRNMGEGPPLYPEDRIKLRYPDGKPKRKSTKRIRGGISPTLRARILERDGFRCRRCGCGPNDARLVIDHVIPVARGGLTIDTNLQVLCDPCNQGKGDRLPVAHDFRGIET